MYKAHFEKWSIRKNLNRKIAQQKIAQRVAVLVSGETSGKDVCDSAQVDAERLKRYLRRLSPDQYQKMQELTALKALEAMECRDAPKGNSCWQGASDLLLSPLTRTRR
jgi:hypothetical protein